MLDDKKRKWLDGIADRVKDRLTGNRQAKVIREVITEDTSSEEADRIREALAKIQQMENFVREAGGTSHIGLWHMGTRLQGPRLFTTQAAHSFLNNLGYRLGGIIGPYAVNISMHEDAHKIIEQATANYNRLLAANGHEFIELFNDPHSYSTVDGAKAKSMRPRAIELDNSFQAIGYDDYHFTLD